MKLVFIPIFLFSVAASVLAQNTIVHPGITLFEQGRHREAIAELTKATKVREHRSNPAIWNYLGLAYAASGNVRKARKPIERAVKLDGESPVYRATMAYLLHLEGNPSRAKSEADKALAVNPRNLTALQVRAVSLLRQDRIDEALPDIETILSTAPRQPHGYMLKAEAIKHRIVTNFENGTDLREQTDLLREVVSILESGIKVSEGNERFANVKKEHWAMSMHYAALTRDPSKPKLGDQPGFVNYRIIRRPSANFTEAGRRNLGSGYVRVRVILGASGQVEHVWVLKRLGYGLEQQAVAAARKIEFVPRMIDGKPVDVIITVDYSFEVR
jgi:TonB family protein